ncbi:hypothetical protein [Adhaeribacter aerolatus]|uniref:hypothetical protein n=1 Tax=Adhaeribacter aerolatus TaxID=670289 RepID=UPI0011BD498E|nr:hypothetical protein [Adhaeribacter aerolatus]
MNAFRVCTSKSYYRQRADKIRTQKGIYLIGFAVVAWVDVFTWKDYDRLITSGGKFAVLPERKRIASAGKLVLLDVVAF